MGKRIPVVAVGKEGQLLSYYESIFEAAKMNGFDSSAISRAVRLQVPYKKIRWVKEPDYRKLWMEGRTSELAYSIKERRKESACKGWRTRTKEQRDKQREVCRRARLEYLKTHPANTGAGIEVVSKPLLCVSTGKTYKSIAAMARDIGASSSSVSRAANTGHKVKGLIVKFIT